MLGRGYTKIYRVCYVGEMVYKDIQIMLCWGDGGQRYANYAMLGRWYTKIYKLCYAGEMVYKDIQIMICWGDGVQRYTNYAMLGRWYAKIYKLCYVGEMVCKDIQIMLCWRDGVQRYANYAMLGRWYTKIYKLCFVREMMYKDIQIMLFSKTLFHFILTDQSIYCKNESTITNLIVFGLTCWRIKHILVIYCTQGEHANLSIIHCPSAILLYKILNQLPNA
jgi:hypothetical protein